MTNKEWIDIHESPFTCLKCGERLDTNGFIMWCQNAHVWEILPGVKVREQDKEQ